MATSEPVTRDEIERTLRETAEELLIARQRLALVRVYVEDPNRWALSPGSAVGMIKLALNSQGPALAQLLRERNRSEPTHEGRPIEF